MPVDPEQLEEFKQIEKEKPWEQFYGGPDDEDDVQNEQWWKDADDEERAIWWWKFVGFPQEGIFYIEQDEETDAALGDVSKEKRDESGKWTKDNGSSSSTTELQQGASIEYDEDSEETKWLESKPDQKHSDITPSESRPELTENEQSALGAYTGGDYHGINDKLRGVNKNPMDEGQETTHRNLEAAFKKAQPFKQPVRVCRQVTLYREDQDKFIAMAKQAMEEGGTFHMPGYSSTSTYPNNIRGNVRMVIEARLGLDAQPFSSIPEEDEILLPHNTQVRIKSVEQTPRAWIIHMEQIIPSEVGP